MRAESVPAVWVAGTPLPFPGLPGRCRGAKPSRRPGEVAVCPERGLREAAQHDFMKQQRDREA